MSERDAGTDRKKTTAHKILEKQLQMQRTLENAVQENGKMKEGQTNRLPPDLQNEFGDEEEKM